MEYVTAIRPLERSGRAHAHQFPRLVSLHDPGPLNRQFHHIVNLVEREPVFIAVILWGASSEPQIPTQLIRELGWNGNFQRATKGLEPRGAYSLRLTGLDSADEYLIDVPASWSEITIERITRAPTLNLSVLNDYCALYWTFEIVTRFALYGSSEIHLEYLFRLGGFSDESVASSSVELLQAEWEGAGPVGGPLISFQAGWCSSRAVRTVNNRAVR